ncbi:uncharacterized protein LOC120113125 [Phoenix dactylifera]|uniref:Uncharacterized protein LOC120113125 n=1 Tax=Phoenix dactylifera TaxID=42345 RepID=A0A8B9B278_PHODC|nr:uncharacterized protein LOC120113125 [Phoenix dactylifera]
MNRGRSYKEEEKTAERDDASCLLLWGGDRPQSVIYSRGSGRRPADREADRRSLLASLEDEIRALRSWQSRPEPESGSPDWICAGLAQIELLHTSLDDLLQLLQAQDTLRHRSSTPWTDRLLDDFLRFADAYGSFRSVLISLKETQFELQTAIRRRDEARVASSIRSQKRIQKDLAKLVVSIREASRSPAPALAADAAEREMAGIMREATAATTMASAAVFLGIRAVSSSASESKR